MYLGTSQPYPGRAVYLPNRRTVYGMGQFGEGFGKKLLLAAAGILLLVFVVSKRKKKEKRRRKSRKAYRQYRKGMGKRRGR